MSELVYRDMYKKDSLVLPKGTYWLSGLKHSKSNNTTEIIIVDTSNVYKTNRSLALGSWRFLKYDKVFLQKEKVSSLTNRSTRAIIHNRKVNAVLKPKSVELSLREKL